ncbi:MAG: ABC transporter permease [Actinobacteria bacterium]|nr:ABC transporter permease [Actinomycetota bacterium]
MSTAPVAARRIVGTQWRSWKPRLGDVGLKLLGVLAFLSLWQAATSAGLLGEAFGADFGPVRGLRALGRLAASGVLVEQSSASLGRLGLGLGIAVLIGAPLGVLVGYSRPLDAATSVVFQFLRMTSPLALVPVALVAFGVGSRPVVFLVAFAALWPVLLSTAHGVSRVSPIWKRVVRGFGGGDRAVVRRVIIPATVPDLLQGVRLALGVSWVVIVPAEMLGVDSGLGYQILDARDRFAYDELVATILAIGLLGYLTDLALRWLKERYSWSV